MHWRRSSSNTAFESEIQGQKWHIWHRTCWYMTFRASQVSRVFWASKYTTCRSLDTSRGQLAMNFKYYSCLGVTSFVSGHPNLTSSFLDIRLPVCISTKVMHIKVCMYKRLGPGVELNELRLFEFQARLYMEFVAVQGARKNTIR